jgi:catechol 2,3-dioxygenase-like lactoylglutathione lyase family enzyme
MTAFDQQVTFLLVADLDRSSSFYGQTLGLELVLDQGDCRIYRVSSSAFVGICERAERGDPNTVLVTLVTDDVDGCHQDLVAAGVVCEKAPQHNQKYNVYHAFYRDPDGYLIEVQRFLDPAWPRHNHSA